MNLAPSVINSPINKAGLALVLELLTGANIPEDNYKLAPFLPCQE